MSASTLIATVSSFHPTKEQKTLEKKNKDGRCGSLLSYQSIEIHPEAEKQNILNRSQKKKQTKT